MKPIDDFRVLRGWKGNGKRLGHDSWCKECYKMRHEEWFSRHLAERTEYLKEWRSKHRGYSKNYYIKHPEQSRLTRRNSTKKAKLKAFAIYGNKCQNCNDPNLLHLQFHHHNGKKDEKRAYYKMLEKILKAGKVLEEYGLYCANCHIDEDIKDGTSNRGSLL
jgi:hypothetical protein